MASHTHSAQVERLEVVDTHANGQALTFVYSRDSDARQAKVLTKDEAWRVAVNAARLTELFGKADRE
jgi:hypothetical protein